MPRWSDLPDELKNRFKAPPDPAHFQSEEEYGDAVSYWQQTVGRNIGFALQQLSSAQSKAESKKGEGSGEARDVGKQK